MAKYLDITGHRFGRLEVVEFAGYDKHKSVTWRCKCECGNETVVRSDHLRYGKTSSCGCLKAEESAKRGRDNATHGMWNTRLYHCWQHMKQRCDGTGNEANRKRYYDRGITVCEEWLNSFETFMEWALNNGYKDSLTLDRIDNDGNYEPFNCRWADTLTQQNNVTSNRYIKYKGDTLTIAEMARKYDIGYSTLSTRLERGWSIERALGTRVRQYIKKS